jgi:hypothetical protein
MATQEVIPVRVGTLDATPDIAEGTGETLLKLDVQGNELRVLRGGRRTLSRVDHVLCEVNFDLLFEGQASFAEIHDELAKAGFRYAGALLQIHGENGRVVFADELFTRRDLRSLQGR